jgi:AbiU2
MAIPPQLTDAWTFLQTEVVWLHGRWEIYCDLYGASPERIGLLNRTAPTFFAMLQGILLNDVQLTLSKLADPAATFKRPNLTLETLLHGVSGLPERQLATKLTPLLANYRAACERVKARRNKDIAHFDFATQISPARKAEILPGPSRQEIDAALTALREFMKEAFGHFEGRQMAYELFSLHDGAHQLLLLLKQGVRYDELVEAGTIDLVDLAKSPYFGV